MPKQITVPTLLDIEVGTRFQFLTEIDTGNNTDTPSIPPTHHIEPEICRKCQTFQSNLLPIGCCAVLYEGRDEVRFERLDCAVLPIFKQD